MGRRFVDRHDELRELEREYSRDGASFFVVYGRRRLGKTALISRFCEGKQNIFFLATEESEQQNLNAFRELVAEVLDNSLLRAATLERWEPIFEVIAEKAKTEKLVLVIDEFQYLGKANQGFPSVFMKIWDEILSSTQIKLIICGSLIKMMKSQVLSYSSPLYGRRTGQLRMAQVPYTYYHEFMPEKSEEERILRYAITGGVPKYIELFDDDYDIYEAISRNILNRSSFLYAEPDFLLSKEVSEIGSYFSVLKVIASGGRKLSEISSRLEVSQTNLSSYLKTLAELDLVEREVPITEENASKSKSGQYVIKDLFIRFWFLFVYPYRNLLETGHEEYVEKRIKEHLIDSHVAYVYEMICREKMWDFNGEFATFNRVGRWWNKNTEIDIVAYDSTGQDMVFGECKYSVRPKGVDVLSRLKDKAAVVPWNKKTRRESFVLFGHSGFSEELKELAKDDPRILLVAGV